MSNTTANEKGGKCDGCEKPRKVLTPIESGQRLCGACLKAIRGPRPPDMATWQEIEKMRAAGFNVGPELTKDRLRVLRMIRDAFQHHGIRLPESASQADVKAAIANHPSTFTATLRGITGSNADGTRRQALLARCTEGERLLLVRGKGNKFGVPAIAVTRSSGEQLGFWADWGCQRDSVTGLAEYLDRGGEYAAELFSVEELEPRPPRYENGPLGALIDITYYPRRCDGN